MATIYKIPGGLFGDPPEKAQSLPDIIYQRLRLAILNGELRRGQFLRQEELARAMDVSRVPLREALSRLEADGLIILRPRRGYAVNSLDQAAIVEIFDLRSLVEAHAGSIAAHARTNQDVHEVEQLVEKMEKLDHRQPTYVSDWFALNRAFHARIISSSQRNRVSRLAATLLDTVEPYIRNEAEFRKRDDVRRSNTEHREMLEALRARDANALAELSRNHVQNVGKHLLGAMRRNAARAPAGGHIPEGFDAE